MYRFLYLCSVFFKPSSKMFACSVCPQNFSEIALLLKHISIHFKAENEIRKESDFKNCSEFDIVKLATKYSTSGIHKVVEAQERSRNCERKLVDNSKEKPFECLICRKQFRYQWSQIKHERRRHM